MKRIVSLLVCLFLFSWIAIFGQDVQIRGTVTSGEDGTSLPGVYVKIRGTNTGTATDIDGKYQLAVPSGATLVFSSIGFIEQEVAVAGQSVIDVVLPPDVTQMEEVVVTALGITRERKSLGYAVQDVKASELNSSIQTSALGALAGKVAGLDVVSSTKIGGSSRLLIRGANSITGENQPLIVIDGIPMDNQNFGTNADNGAGGYDLGNMFNDITPENVENITVLKGPAAAIYGSRAANGVIVITTKKATRSKRGYSVELNSNIGFEQIYLLPKLQRKYGGGAIISDEDDGVNGFEQITIGNTNYLIPQYQVDESWGPRYDPNILVLPWNAFDQESFPNDYLRPVPWVAPKYDVIDYYDLGINFTNNIAVSNAGENHTIRFSYTNVDTKGTMPGSEQKKNNFSLTGTAKLGNRVDVNSTLNYLDVYTKGRPQVGYGDNSTGQKFFQWGQRQLDFETLKDYKNIDGTQRTWNRSYWDDPTPQYSDNPYWTAYENFPDDSRKRFYGNIGLNVKIIENLSFKGTINGDMYTLYNRERSAVGSQAVSFYYEGVTTNSEFNYEGILNYGKQLNNFNFNVFAGGNIRKVDYEFNRGQTSGGLVVPEIYSLLNSAGNVLTNDITEKKQVNSLFASGAVDYKGILFLELTARNDWSSTLPPENNSYFYPAVSTSFLFSELLKSVNWLDLGKIRLGWAQVGNDTDPYKVYSTYTYNTNGPFQGAPRLFAPTGLLNANLKAETTTSIEFGLDLALFQNRVRLDFTYFDNVTTDQIITLEVSKASGYNTKWINAGQMSNKGVEISLGLTPVKLNNFEWDFRANYAKVNNKVDKLYPGVTTLNIVTAPFSGVVLRASEGDKYGQLWGYDFIYDSDGNRVVGSNGYYLRTPQLVPLGSVLPDYTLGIRNSFTIFKSIDLSVLFDIRKGGKYYSISHMWGMYSGMLEETAGINDKGNEIRDAVSEGGGIKLDAVKGTVTYNDDGTYTVTNTTPNDTYVSALGWAARFYHGYGTPSAQSLFNADFIKLRELTIGYSLPARILGPLSSAKISLYGRNLLTFGLDQPGFDPEAFVNGSGNIQGIDGGLFPSSRTFGINIQLGF